MKHGISPRDRSFRRAFERFDIAPEEFDHRAHVRLAYIYLCGHGVDGAHGLMKRSLLAFLNHVGAGTAKYHETITRSWIMAVNHFMAATPGCRSAEEFIERNPKLLDTGIMLRHYSAAVLFSPRARDRFVAPDLNPIPED